MQLICGLMFTWLLVRSSSAAHPPSPCPDIFSYEGEEPENNRWYGEITLRTDESLVGIRLDVELDRPSDLMVSWLGDISTNDNVKFTILNLNEKLRPGPPVLSRIMVKFNRSTGSPKVRFIRLNGRKICPEDSSYVSPYEENTPRPPKPQSTRRPDPEFGDNYGENGEEYPVNGGNLNNNNNRPTTQPISNNNNNNNYNSRPNSQQPNSNNNYYNNNSPNTDYSPTNVVNNNNRPVYRPPSTTTTTTEEPYTTRKPPTKVTTMTTRNPYEGNRPNNNNNNNNNNLNNSPNTVSLQASSTEINGVINGLLLDSQNANKTVIITVIDKNDPQNKWPNNNNNQAINNNNNQQNNRPNSANGNNNNNNNNQNQQNNRPSSGGSSRPPVPAENNNSGIRPNVNQQNPSNSQRPNNNQGGGSSSNLSNSQQVSSTCGNVKLATPLVTAGQSTHRGQWPWHVALYLIEGINLSYHCGGSLVAKNKVITAAHCVTNKQTDAVINNTKIVVYLGKYHQLQYSDELGVQTKQVTRINVYPYYNSSNYLGDIAILTLSSDAEFTNYVTPVCLWDEKSDNLNDIVDKEGTVVGWGFDENDTPTEELKMAKMPVVSHQTCLWSYPQFYSEFTSDKTFCAGFRNGTSVCNGDSGGGMVFSKNSRWHLRGIVSITVAKEGLRVCDTRHYVVFTDVSKYLDFIKKNMR